MPNSIILKGVQGLTKLEPQYKKFLDAASKLSFWRTHFQNHNFIYQAEKFNWQYWQAIPFFTKADFLRIGFEKRFADVAAQDPKPQLYFRVTSGTSGTTEPVLIPKKLTPPREIPDEKHSLWLYAPYTMCLRGVLLNNACNKEKNTNQYQALIVDPHTLTPQMQQAIVEFNPDTMAAFPLGIGRLASFFSEGTTTPLLKKAYLGGDFLTKPEYQLTLNVFNNLEIILNYGLAEFGNVGKPCSFSTRRYGFNAYHPRQGALIELVDVDAEGRGEIVATSRGPLESALIRYRTGDLGRAVREKCPCGQWWTLFLEGRKGFESVKCGGTLVVLPELKRVMDTLKEYVIDWRAEAREVTIGNTIRGELTLYVQPTNRGSTLRNNTSFISSEIGSNLFITPTQTLAQLVQAQKFMPLVLKIVDDFPEVEKRVPLRKVE